MIKYQAPQVQVNNANGGYGYQDTWMQLYSPVNTLEEQTRQL